MKYLVLMMMMMTVFACGEQDSHERVDVGMKEVDNGKSDRLLDLLTVLKGSFGLGEWVNESIDAPDYFHGYTMELTRGQRLSIRVDAGDESEVRLYQNGTKLLHRTSTKRMPGHGETTTFELDVEEDGEHLLVLGPKFVWKSKYSFIVDCLERCSENAHEAEFVSVAELNAAPAAFDGRHIVIDGFVNIGSSICTQRTCDSENLCCNGCGAEQRLGDTEGHEGVQLLNSGQEMSCTGTNCSFRSNCEISPGPYVVEGVFRDGGDPFLHSLEVFTANSR